MPIDFSLYRATDVELNISRMTVTPLDVMITGVTGAGKSTTINTLFSKNVAKVGTGVDPETMDLNYYSLNDRIRFWDTPGLGDGVSRDKTHKKRLIDLLYKKYSSNDQDYGFIDMVLVIIEGANRDMGTTYTLLNEVIIPKIQRDRILVAINQADMGMKGAHWIRSVNKPDEILLNFLKEQAFSVKSRVKEATGVNIITPVCYSAEYNYNIERLMDMIIDNMPTQKRNLMK